MLYRNNRYHSHTFLLLPPFRRQERLYQRRSVRLLITKTTFEENAEKTLLYSNKDYAIEVTLITFWKKTLLEVNFSERLSAIQNKQKTRKIILPLLTEYRPSVPNLKTILMIKWHLIENQPMPREIYKDPPLQKREIFESRAHKSKAYSHNLSIPTNSQEPCLACHHYFAFSDFPGESGKSP